MRIIETCPKCGHDLVDLVLTTYPPIPQKKCFNITQANNRRTNTYITWNDETHTIAEWARLFGITYSALIQRIHRGNMKIFEEYFGGVSE